MHTHTHKHIHACAHSPALRPGDHQHFPLDSASGPGRSLGVDPPTCPLGALLPLFGLLGGGREALPFWPEGRSLNPSRTPPPHATNWDSLSRFQLQQGRSKLGDYISTELASRDVLQGHPHSLLTHPKVTPHPAFIDSLFPCVGKTRRLVLNCGFQGRSLLL